MAEKHFGGTIPVSLQSVFDTIAAKNQQDVAALKALFDNVEGIHDFEEQHRVLARVHANVRAMDILLGQVDHRGETIAREAEPQVFQAPKNTTIIHTQDGPVAVDLDKLGTDIMNDLTKRSTASGTPQAQPSFGSDEDIARGVEIVTGKNPAKQEAA